MHQFIFLLDYCYLYLDLHKLGSMGIGLLGSVQKHFGGCGWAIVIWDVDTFFLPAPLHGESQFFWKGIELGRMVLDGDHTTARTNLDFDLPPTPSTLTGYDSCKKWEAL